MTTFEPRTATITIYQGDYLDRIRHLERKAEAAKDAAGSESSRLAHEIPEYLAIAERHDALVAEAEASAVNVKVKALGRRAWRDLVAKHPPRTVEGGASEADSKSDAAVGVNEETFKDELVAASIAEPEFSSRAACDEFTDSLADVDYDRLYYTAFALNRSVAADPKASLVSTLSRANDETSN